MKKIYYLLGFLFISFLIVLGLVLTQKIVSFDESIYQMLFSLRNDFWDTFFRIITMTANTVTVICVLVVLVFLLERKYQILCLSSVLVTVSTNLIVKNIIQRARPEHLRLVTENGFSFPSGHAMISIALYGFLIYYVYCEMKDKKMKIFLIILLSLLIVGIGCSRIYLGVHYPSDVLGGYFLALIILLFLVSRGCNRYDQNDCK